MRGGYRAVLVHLEKCWSWFLRTPFFFDKSAATPLHQHLGKMCQHVPSRLPILTLLIFVLSTTLSREGWNVLCLKWKEVSWGITKCTGTVFDCFALARVLGLFSCLFGSYHLLPVCLIINNAVSTLPIQQTPKWRQPALQILRVRKVTSRNTVKPNEKNNRKRFRRMPPFGGGVYKYVYSCLNDVWLCVFGCVCWCQRARVHMYLLVWVE